MEGVQGNRVRWSLEVDAVGILGMTDVSRFWRDDSNGCRLGSLDLIVSRRRSCRNARQPLGLQMSSSCTVFAAFAVLMSATSQHSSGRSAYRVRESPVLPETEMLMYSAKKRLIE